MAPSNRRTAVVRVRLLPDAPGLLSSVTMKRFDLTA
jgi:hypothetical protein